MRTVRSFVHRLSSSEQVHLKVFKLFRDGILQDIEHEENILENVFLPMKSLSVNNVTFALRYFSISIPCYAFFQ